MSDSTTAHLQELLNRHRAGDGAARDGLLEHSLDRLRLLARKMFRRNADLKAYDETDDVVSKAMVRLYKALDSVHPETVRAYFAIAANHIRWVLRDLAREPGRTRITYGDSVPEPPAGGDEPADLEEWTAFHEAIEKLPEPERELFDLLLYQGLEQAEAAALLGIPLRTFKRKWQHARLMLSEALGDDR